jgi:hypothetical protein
MFQLSRTPTQGLLYLILAVVLGACGLSTTVPSSGSVAAKVTSVVATLDPYNPMLANQGIPAEAVAFTIGPVAPDRQLSCDVRVFHLGRLVGHGTVGVESAVTVGTGPVKGPVPGGGTVSTTVEGIRGGTFAGKPSDGQVTCHVVGSFKRPSTSIATTLTR